MILTKTQMRTPMKTNMILKNLFPEFLALTESNVEEIVQKKLYYPALDPDPVWFALGIWNAKTPFGIVQNVIAVFISNVFNVGLKTAFFSSRGTLKAMIWWTYQDRYQESKTRVTKKIWNGVVQNVERLIRKQKRLKDTLVIVEKSRIHNLILGLFHILVEKLVKKIWGLIVDINVWFFVIRDLVHHVQK